MNEQTDRVIVAMVPTEMTMDINGFPHRIWTATMSGGDQLSMAVACVMVTPAQASDVVFRKLRDITVEMVRAGVARLGMRYFS